MWRPICSIRTIGLLQSNYLPRVRRGFMTRIKKCSWPPQITRLACSEMPDGTLHTIARAVAFHRIDRVVISRPGLKAIDAHAEYGVGMITIQPDVGFRDLV